MADLKFVLFDLEENEVTVGKLLSYELCRESDAPCDGLRLNFVNDNVLPELYKAKAYIGKRCVFNGYVDTQRETVHKNSVECFLYCRSSACLLTDSEAKPFAYTSPSARALYEINIGKNFKYNLGEVFSDITYQVSKDTSLFGVLNGFVYSVTGENIRVTPNDEIVLLKTDKAVELDKSKIVMLKRIINRGGAISKIDYKINNATDYIYHRISKFMRDKKITASKVSNISTVPDWQRETTLKSAFSTANSDYCGWKITMCGYIDVDLTNRLIADIKGFDSYGDVVVNGVTHTFDSNGERTVIDARCVLDLEEMSYVDE